MQDLILRQSTPWLVFSILVILAVGGVVVLAVWAWSPTPAQREARRRRELGAVVNISTRRESPHGH